MKIRLTPRADAQLRALPIAAAQRVVKALRLLERFPASGSRYPADSPFAGSYYKVVVVRAKRWAHRITYDLRGNELWVRYLYPSWYPLTHPDLAVLSPEDEPRPKRRR